AAVQVGVLEIGAVHRCDKEGMGTRVTREVRVADHLTRGVDAAGITEGAAERAQIGGYAILPEDGVEVPGGRVRPANYLAAGIDAGGLAGRAAEGTEVGRHAVLPKGGVACPVCEHRDADHLAGGVDIGGRAKAAAEIEF